MTSAAAKLQPSRLSDQLETLNTDVDLASLNLAVKGKASFPLLESVTSATIERTIAGSTTLTIVARDRDRTLIRSGYIGGGLDCEIDGLWFRLWHWSKSGDDLTLIFIDREIAVLKAWPPTSEGVKMYRHWPAGKFGVRTRFRFAQKLVEDVADQLPIRFRCPGLTDAVIASGDAAVDKAANKHFGFAAGANVTVKTRAATKTQIANIETVLDTGVGLGARRKVLIAAVEVITQESKALTSATNGDHVGLFQQSAAAGWPATRDPATDATAFFDAAIGDDRTNPNLAIEDLADDVQVSGHPELYAQWETEATTTVDLYMGSTDTTLAVTAANAPDPTRGQFMRGTLESPTAAARKHKTSIILTSQGNKVVVREDNWTCLTRLASEIGWRCFMVSGTLYFIDDYTLFHQQVAMTVSERDSSGVDVFTIDPDFTQGVQNAQCTVTCHAARWNAAPGQVVAVADMGPASGRWLVTSISRSLFNQLTTIILTKPMLSIPESAAPEHGAGQTSGAVVYTPTGQRKQAAAATSVWRKAIVAAAREAINVQSQSAGTRFHYRQARPMPNGLFAENPEYIDCSAFATLVYKAAGVPDPNGYGYNGRGDTGSLAAAGIDPGKNPQPGDLVFYHDTWARPGHVAVFLGNGRIANMGSEGEPVEEDVTAPGNPLGYRSYSLGQ